MCNILAMTVGATAICVFLFKGTGPFGFVSCESQFRLKKGKMFDEVNLQNLLGQQLIFSLWQK